MKINNFRLVIILGTFAITGIFIVQIYWMKKAWNANEIQFNQTIHIALKNVAENLFKYNNIEPPNENPVNQLSSNYFVVNTNSEIDANILEYYLITEFDLLNLNIDFEYAIYDCSNDKMVYGNYVSSEGKKSSILESSILPKYDEYIYYFGINFPTRNSYIGNKMSVWIIFSLLLIVAVVFFCYSLFIILKQKRLSEQQKDFINNMTHEFKTPISTINISSDVILDPEIINNPERLFNYGNLIKQENKRLNEQVEKVLNIAKVEQKYFNLDKEHIDLHELIKSVVQGTGVNNNFKNVKTIVSLNAEKFKIFADKLHLTNILYNIMDNAVKYGTENPVITFSTENDTKKLSLKIADNGPGIEKEYHKKIFDKFFRIPTGNVHDVKGFGLGLYYVKYICFIHKWKIHLESNLNEGSCFEIIMPLS